MLVFPLLVIQFSLVKNHLSDVDFSQILAGNFETGIEVNTNIKSNWVIMFYQYRDPRVKDKTVATVLSLTWESPYLERRSLYWDGALVFYAATLYR